MNRPSTRRRVVAGLALVAYLALLAVITLSPEPAIASRVVGRVSEALGESGAPAALVTRGRVELVLNVAMVAPATFLGALVWPGWSWRDWTAAGFVLSLGVELAQGLLLPDRSAQTKDVVANTAGALLGGALAGVMRRISGDSQTCATD